MNLHPVAIAVAVALAGCTVPSLRTSRLETPAPALPATLAGEASNYTYRLLTPEQTGLTQVLSLIHI